MRIMIVGGAGYVGSIIRPALEEQYDCRHLDLVAPPGAEAHRVTIGDVHDEQAVTTAVQGADCVLYLAMGKDAQGHIHAIQPAVSVNVGGTYHVLRAALAAGVRRFVYASSLSVYENLHSRLRQDEHKPADAWTRPYGVSKRLGEAVCAMAAQHHPQASILALRLMLPQNDHDWQQPGKKVHMCPLGPNDTRRLFLAAVEFARPGLHIVQASGDLQGELFPNDAAERLLGWRPHGD
jgi:nucleoside-diphosphate-sugar epimerase